MSRGLPLPAPTEARGVRLKLARLLARARQFWTEPVSGHSVALFRISFGLLALWTALGLGLNLERFFSEAGLVPYWVVESFPYARWSLLAISPRSEIWLSVVWLLFTLSASGFLLGIAPRACALGVFVCWLSFQHRNPYILNSGDRLFGMVAGLSIFLPTAQKWALSGRLWARLKHTPRNTTRPPSIWSQRLISLQIAYVYWFAFFAKIRAERWQNGWALSDVLASPVYAEWPIQLGYPISAALSWSTLVFELSFPLLVWFKRFRPWVLGAGIFFHLGIELTMTLPMFSAAMLVTYPLFLRDAETQALIARLKSSFSRSKVLAPALSGEQLPECLLEDDGTAPAVATTPSADERRPSGSYGKQRPSGSS